MQEPPEVEWKSGLCDCFEDAATCCYGFWCCPFLACTVSRRLGECCALPLCDCLNPGIPPAALSARVAIRNRYRIKGSMLNDIMTSCCCVWCSWCQMHRELKLRSQSPTIINMQTQAFIQMPAPTMIQQNSPTIIQQNGPQMGQPMMVPQQGVPQMGQPMMVPQQGVPQMGQPMMVPQQGVPQMGEPMMVPQQGVPQMGEPMMVPQQGVPQMGEPMMIPQQGVPQMGQPMAPVVTQQPPMVACDQPPAYNPECPQ